MVPWYNGTILIWYQQKWWASGTLLKGQKTQFVNGLFHQQQFKSWLRESSRGAGWAYLPDKDDMQCRSRLSRHCNALILNPARSGTTVHHGLRGVRILWTSWTPWTPWRKSTMDITVSIPEEAAIKESLVDYQTFVFQSKGKSLDYIYIRDRSLEIWKMRPHIDLWFVNLNLIVVKRSKQY